MQEKKGIWGNIYQNLASIKLTVFVFITLAVCSVIGTLLPQGVDPHEIEAHYRPATAWVVNTFGLNDLYRTWWFRCLLLLLCANLIVCTIERLPKTIKLLQRRKETVDPQKLMKFSISRQISTRLPREETESILTKVIAEAFAPVQLHESGESFPRSRKKGVGALSWSTSPTRACW